jgi:hypothetical protein
MPRITAWVHELERDALRGGVNQTFTIVRSHYAIINLEVLSEGYLDSYEDEELQKLESDVAPLSQVLVDRIEDVVLPQRG